MNTSEFRFVDGTSALKPDCSRYSNENEHIIDFNSAVAAWNAEVDYSRLAQARHAKTSDRIGAHVVAKAANNQFIKDIRYGGIEGKSFNMQDAWKMKAYGCLYTAMALAVIILSV